MQWNSCNIPVTSLGAQLHFIESPFSAACWISFDSIDDNVNDSYDNVNDSWFLLSLIVLKFAFFIKTLHQRLLCYHPLQKDAGPDDGTCQVRGDKAQHNSFCYAILILDSVCHAEYEITCASFGSQDWGILAKGLPLAWRASQIMWPYDCICRYCRHSFPTRGQSSLCAILIPCLNEIVLVTNASNYALLDTI